MCESESVVGSHSSVLVLAQMSTTRFCSDSLITTGELQGKLAKFCQSLLLRVLNIHWLIVVLELLDPFRQMGRGGTSILIVCWFPHQHLSVSTRSPFPKWGVHGSKWRDKLPGCLDIGWFVYFVETSRLFLVDESMVQMLHPVLKL